MGGFHCGLAVQITIWYTLLTSERISKEKELKWRLGRHGFFHIQKIDSIMQREIRYPVSQFVAYDEDPHRIHITQGAMSPNEARLIDDFG